MRKIFHSPLREKAIMHSEFPFPIEIARKVDEVIDEVSGLSPTSVAGKADKSYVDLQLLLKANVTDIPDVSSKVDNSTIGNLSDLTTTVKTNLVAAINEAASSGGSCVGQAGTGTGSSVFNAGDPEKATGDYSHIEGGASYATGKYSHAEGLLTTANGETSHAEGYNTFIHNSAKYSHAEGVSTKAYAVGSHVEGLNTQVTHEYGHAEGKNTSVSGDIGHAEGCETSASGSFSHAEGWNSTASGVTSHAEGSETSAIGYYSHSEGGGTSALGQYSHAEGFLTVANSQGSHAEGIGTEAAGIGCHAEGKYNLVYTGAPYIHMIGNGTDDENRHNAFAVGKTGSSLFLFKEDGTPVELSVSLLELLLALLTPTTPGDGDNGEPGNPDSGGETPEEPTQPTTISVTIDGTEQSVTDGSVTTAVYYSQNSYNAYNASADDYKIEIGTQFTAGMVLYSSCTPQNVLITIDGNSLQVNPLLTLQQVATQQNITKLYTTNSYDSSTDSLESKEQNLNVVIKDWTIAPLYTTCTDTYVAPVMVVESNIADGIDADMDDDSLTGGFNITNVNDLRFNWLNSLTND